MFHLDTLAAATLTLLLGRKLVHSVSFLKKYTIPNQLQVVCWWRWRYWY
ncbi:Sodium/glutamate symport protein [Escherichia coli]|nr:Sodium/glutamate symport protein [Escherichia coli]